MAKIECLHCLTTQEAMDAAPVGGSLGELLLRHTCRSCWQLWVDQQLLIINHYGLQLADPEDRRQLTSTMKEFLNLPEPPGNKA
ncbi:MAG: Fe(2+)-trafficking protein [Armatimonadetes bacterium]|nr:Fe(2+)-trafficking protein [Armatimonadota bacterium]MDE2206480.1 Fe(2+)-trafficking protein [Armatimonadota bacterium]